MAEDEAWEASGSESDLSEDDTMHSQAVLAAQRARMANASLAAAAAQNAIGSAAVGAAAAPASARGGLARFEAQIAPPEQRVAGPVSAREFTREARPPSGAPPGGPSAPGMATLIGHLRCDNLKLRGALIEAQREVEELTVMLEEKEEEVEKLREELVPLKAVSEASARGGGAAEAGGPAANEEGSRPEAAPAAEEEPPPAAEEPPKQPTISMEEKERLEQQLVKSKMRCAQAEERIESMEQLVSYYEEQLVALNPQFRTVAAVARTSQGAATLPLTTPRPSGGAEASPATASQDSGTPATARRKSGEGSSNPDGKKKSSKGVKKLVSGMFKHSHHKERGSRTDGLGTEALGGGTPGSRSEPVPGKSAAPSADEDAQRQKQVIACLMAELDKANRERQDLQARLAAGRGGSSPAPAEQFC